MPETKVDELLSRLPEVAKAVNEFTSETAQLRVLDALLGALGHIAETSSQKNGIHEGPESSPHGADQPTTHAEQPRAELPATPQVEKAGRRRTRKSVEPSFLSDLNLRPKDKQTLRQFYDTKQPATNEQTFAVMIYYMKHVLKIETIGANHVYTAYKDLGLKVPLRLATVISNAAGRHHWINTKSSNDYQMTTHGENFVEHDLPPKSKVKKS